MSFLSGFFQGNSKGPQFQPSNTTVRQEMDPAFKKRLEESLDLAKAESGRNVVAGPNKDINNAYNLARNSIGQGQSQLGRAAELFGRGEQNLHEMPIEKYMNPYAQSVLEPQLRRANQDFLKRRQNIRGAFAGSGGGGDKIHQIEQEAFNDYQQIASDIQNRALSDAWEKAYGLSAADRSNAQQSALNQLRLGNIGREFSSEDFQNLLGIGGQQQAQQQRELLGPRENINFYHSLLTGSPYDQTSFQNNTPSYHMFARNKRPQQIAGALLKTFGGPRRKFR